MMCETYDKILWYQELALNFTDKTIKSMKLLPEEMADLLRCFQPNISDSSGKLYKFGDPITIVGPFGPIRLELGSLDDLDMELE